MKYCISGRQSKYILEKADEIKLSYKDIDILPAYLRDYPTKTIVLDIPKEAEDIEWNKLKNLAKENNLILCLEDLFYAGLCNSLDIPFYWSYPISSWYELDGLIKLNPCYLFITNPLSFELDVVKKKTNIPLRLCPNLAYDSYIPRENGILGTWVRPEDINIYEKYIDTFEFVINDLSKEATLFRVYQQDGEWPGNLNVLIGNLSVDVDSRMLPKEFGEVRTTCGQRCLKNGRCHFCESAINLSDSIREYYYDRFRYERNN